jgi:aminopeptidase N
MEYVFTSHNYPEFKIWLDFVTTEVSPAMRLDSLRNSHPIEVCLFVCLNPVGGNPFVQNFFFQK